jgi:hypothetical protein
MVSKYAFRMQLVLLQRGVLTTSGNYPATESLILDIVEEIADAKSDDLQESESGSSDVDEAPAADAAVDFSWSWSRGFANGWGGTASDPQRAKAPGSSLNAPGFSLNAPGFNP